MALVEREMNVIASGSCALLIDLNPMDNIEDMAEKIYENATIFMYSTPYLTTGGSVEKQLTIISGKKNEKMAMKMDPIRQMDIAKAIVFLILSYSPEP